MFSLASPCPLPATNYPPKVFFRACPPLLLPHPPSLFMHVSPTETHHESETLTDDAGVVAELGPELAGAVHDAVDADPEPRARARLVTHARAVEPAREDACIP